MKRFFLLSFLICAVASATFAQVQTTTDTFTFTPSTQTVSSNSSFTIQVGVTGSGTNPNPLDGYDLWLVTNSATSGLFKITGITYNSPYNEFASNLPVGGDSFSTAASSGFNRNSVDLGNISSNTANDATPPFNNTLLETLTISTGNLTPGATYTFLSSTTTNAGTSFSDLEDSTGGQFQTAQSQFSVTAVPEPSTWSLLAAGGLLCPSLLLRHRKRVA